MRTLERYSAVKKSRNVIDLIAPWLQMIKRLSRKSSKQ
jgi:hypothetical protein